MLSRSQREDMWRRFKQTDDRRVAERLHAILLLDSGQNADAVSAILRIHSKYLTECAWPILGTSPFGIKRAADGELSLPGQALLRPAGYVLNDIVECNKDLPRISDTYCR
jgi:hypothetical protein